MCPRPTSWHDRVAFGLHFDLHAGVQDTVLGRDLTPEHLKERLSRVEPDWIQCDCKGHAGYTSWPTKVGTTSPGVVKDALRIHRDVTRELGMPLVMHYSGVWDSRAVELHPEWAVVDAKGNRSPNNTCRLSAYRDELMIPQVLELVENYDIDGFWVDGENWATQPCWCERCRTEFAARTGVTDVPMNAEQPHWDAWLAFHRDLFCAHVTAYADAVHSRKPECTICSNWMYTIRQPDPVTAPVDYLSGDYDWIWGADRAAVEGRLLDSRGLSWDLMAWGFIKSGEMNSPLPWCTKTVTHLCQEVAAVVALGGAVSIYDTPQRSGWLSDWHMDTFGEVGRFCRERQPYTWHSTTRSQAAVLHLAPGFYAANDPLYNYGAAAQPLEGALHALLETHRSTDILTEDDALARLDRYRLVVVPESLRLSPEMQAELQRYAAAGGHVLLSGAELAVETPALVGARPADAGGALDHGLYLAVDGQAAPLGYSWRAVTPDAGVEAVARALDQQDCGHNQTDHVVVTRRRVGAGSITAVHGPLFRNYFQGHYPLVRRWFAHLVESLGIAWEVELKAAPRVELVAREKDGALVVNLLNRGAAEMTMPRRVIVEELAPATQIEVRVRCGRPGGVRVVPETAGTEWAWLDGELTVALPAVAIHTVLVIEP